MYTNHFSKMLFETARFRLCCRSFKQRSCCRLSISCGIRRLTDKCTDRHWPDGLQLKKSRTGASDSSQAGGTLRLQNYQNANANHSHFGVTPTHPLNSHQSLSQSLGHWSGYEFNINLHGERNPFRIPWHTSNLDLLGYENKETRWRIYPQAQNQFGLGGRFLW